MILFLDSFAEARGPSEGTIDQAVRAASSLADAYLERRNRVGVVSFGGILRWLPPAMGVRQQYRIVDALIETELARSYLSTSVDVIPRRVLPPQSLVIALTPLLDQRTIMRSARPPRARLRSRRGRRLTRSLRRRAAPQWRRPRLAALDDVAAGAAPPVRARRGSGRRVVDRTIAPGRDRGGDGIQTTHALRLRLALITTAAVAAFVVVLAPLLAKGSMRDDERFLAIVALAALVFPLFGVARLLPWAIAVLAGSVLVASEHGDIGSVGVALGAALLLLVAECTSTAGDLAPLARIERRLAVRARGSDRRRDRRSGCSRRRHPRLCVVGPPAGLATLALGLLATVLLLAIVTGLVARR